MATDTRAITDAGTIRPYTVVENYRRAIDERLTEIARERDTERLAEVVRAVVALLEDAAGSVSTAGFVDVLDERHRPWLLAALAVSVAAGAAEKIPHRDGARYRRR